MNWKKILANAAILGIGGGLLQVATLGGPINTRTVSTAIGISLFKTLTALFQKTPSV